MPQLPIDSNIGIEENFMKSWITGDIFMSSEIERPTLSAWAPWYFVKEILFRIQNSDIDEEHPEWRIDWIAGVAVLRVIGHVLHKVDSVKSAKHSAIINFAWREWRNNQDNHWIFTEFVEKERNSIMKEFNFGATLPADEDNRTLAFKDTEFDATQLFREAVYWWRAQLRSIEVAIIESDSK